MLCSGETSFAWVWRAIAMLELILIALCARDGKWTEWSDWPSCSVSCGRGQQKRYRACHPTPSLGGKWCQGKYTEQRDCDTGIQCPVHGGWSDWTPWTVCSVSCGEGTRHRYRTCSDPHPAAGGQPCEGDHQESEICFALKECPRDGKWSSWGQWSSCSVTCGTGGSIHRYRSCNNPPPLGDGRPCMGPSHSVLPCKAFINCPVNGQWSEWTEWTGCSATCGGGEQRRWRGCDQPPPQYGGSDCNRTEAGEMQLRSCSGDLLHCPVEGGWSDWGDWGECRTPDCHDPTLPGYSLRKRSCDTPYPAHNGSMCQGTFLQAGFCLSPVNCPVDGGWSEWTDWECFKQVVRRTRTCNRPAPSNGGRPCKGTSDEFYAREEDFYRDICPDFLTDDEDVQNGSGSGSGDGEADLINPRKN